MKLSTKSIELKLDKEAFDNGYILLEADSSKDLLSEDELEKLENEYGVYGQLILNKDYELVFLDHAVLKTESLEDLKQLPIKGIYSVPELDIYDVSFSEFMDHLQKIYEANS